MNIGLSARSCLTSGIALTAVGAMAFAPVVAPRELPVPISVTSPALELAASVDPQNLIDTLQGAVDTVVNGAVNIAMLPAEGFVTATTAAQSGAAAIYDALINATTNPQILALLTGLKTTQTTNLGYLVNTAELLAETTNSWLSQPSAGLATNVENALNNAIELTLNALAGVINDPLALSSWASLLSSVVYSALWGAGDLTWATYAGISLPLSLLQLGYGGGYPPDYAGFAQSLAASIANWSNFTGATLTTLAGQTGTPLVESLAKALVAVTTTPLSYLAQGFADASSWAPVYTAIVAPWNIAWAATNLVGSLFYNAGDSIGGAIDAIGAGPFDPASYISALQDFVTAGANIGNDAVWSVNALAQSGPEIVNSLNYGGEFATNAVVNAVAHTVSGLLAAAGAAADTVQAPINVADTITAAVTQGSVLVGTVCTGVGGWIDEAAQKVVDANTAAADQINNWLGGLVPSTPAGAAAVRKAAVAGETDSAVSEPGGSQTPSATSLRSARSPHTGVAPLGHASSRAAAAATPADSHGSETTAKSSAKPKGIGGAKRARAGAA